MFKERLIGRWNGAENRISLQNNPIKLHSLLLWNNSGNPYTKEPREAVESQTTIV